MSALEYQFPDPSQAPASYLEVATNAFHNIVGRWDETTCGGGLKWQIYPENAYGYNYKNAISNGCAFALGARLARYTGEQQYADWAVKIYDWTKKVGMISDKYEVFDGTDDKTNCAEVADETQWTYNNAMYLHGSAFMYDYTNGENVWKERTSGFLKHAELLFFRPFDNATDVMYEWACETGESGRHCNLDQQSFKAYLSRFIAKTAMLAPFTKEKITKYLKASAVGAAKSCSGGADGATCGSKWYTGGWDGTHGVGQQLSALEVTQALLMLKKGTLPAKNSVSKPVTSIALAPSSTSIAKSSAAAPSSTHAAPPSQAPAPSKAPASKAPEDSEAPLSQAPASSKAPTPQTPSSPSEVPSSETPASETKPEVPSHGDKDEPSSKTPEAVQTPSSTLVKPPVVIVTSSAIPIPTSVPASNEQTNSTLTSSSCTSSVTRTVTISPSTTLSTSCTPTTTSTVYVPAPTLQTDDAPPPTIETDVGAPPVVPAPPVAPTTLAPVAPPANSSAPTPDSPDEFTGAAASVTLASSFVLSALVVAVVGAAL
jgi:mannan endo-1,6-alpha-mannosidase